MDQYDYAQLSFFESSLQFQCTDSAEIDQLVEELKKISPRLRIYRQRKFPGGEAYDIGIEKIKMGDDQIEWWVRKYLRDRAWEPIDTYHYKRKSSS